MNDRQGNAPKDTLRRFGYHLEQAVHDAAHEFAGQDVIHFWDDDCLHVPTFGFTTLDRRGDYPDRQESLGAHLPGRSSLTQEDLLTQALFNAGYLGRVSMLAPHRVEYFSLVAQEAERETSKAYGLRLQEFLDERAEETQSFMGFASIVSDGENQSGGMEAAVDALGAVDPWTFVLLDATANPWPQRLRRLLNSGRLVDLKIARLPSSDEILASENFRNIYRGLERAGGRKRTVSTTVDAAALTSLTIMVAQATEHRDGVFPRFYTSSLRLRKLYRSERWFRQLLSFPIPTDSMRQRSGTVWREPYYYNLRARIPSLRPQGSIGNQEIGLSIAELKDLSAEVNDAIIAGADAMPQHLREYRLPDTRPLGEIVDSLESLGMTEVWLGHRPAKYIEYWSEGLNAIKRLSSLEGTKQYLSREFREVAESATSSFALYAAQFDAMVKVSKALSIAHRAEGDRDLATAVANLGLERWGLSVQEAEGNVGIGEGDDKRAGWIFGYVDLGSMLPTTESLERLVGVLFSVDEFRLATKLLEQFPGVESPSLRLLRMAAAVRGSAFVRDEHLGELFTGLTAFWSELESDYSERRRLALGVGYVAFHIWQKSSGAIRVDAPTDLHGYAAFALRVVEENIHEFQRNMLVLGANHLIYVAAAANVTLHDEAAWLTVLREQARITGHYRLFDSLGWREYLMVFRAESSGRPLSDACRRLERAVEDLQQAWRNVYKDREVEDHLETVSDAFVRHCGG